MSAYYHRLSAALLAALLLDACAGPPARHAEGPPPSAQRGYDLIQAGKNREALQVFQEVLKTDPRNHQARLEAGYLSAGLKHWEDAVRYLDEAAEEDPENLRLRMDLAYVREELGEYDAAANDFQFVLRQQSQFDQQARDALKSIEDGSAEGASKAREEGIVNEGYDALRRGDERSARRKFEMALTEDPRATEVQKQLGYMNIEKGELAAAAEQFEGARNLNPNDYSTALQLGYIYDSLHNPKKAQEAFRRAAQSPDREIREAALAALKNLSIPSLYLDLYANPFYTARFADRIAVAEAQFGWRPVKDWPISFYLGTRYTQDSQSHGGRQPQIYSDNVWMIGPGIRIQPNGWDANLIAEFNEDFNRTRTADHPNATETEKRVVLSDYQYWNGPLQTFADLGGSLGYYSRYRDNVIGLLQLRGGIQILKVRSTVLNLYAPVNVDKDVNKDFFNNLVEFGAGVELQPLIQWNLKLRAEYYHGVYFGIEGRDPNPYGPHYEDFRLALIFSKRFALSSGDDYFVAGPRPSGNSKLDWGGYSP